MSASFTRDDFESVLNQHGIIDFHTSHNTIQNQDRIRTRFDLISDTLDSSARAQELDLYMIEQLGL